MTGHVLRGCPATSQTSAFELELVGSSEEGLISLQAFRKRFFGIKLYASLAMSPVDMARLLPHRSTQVKALRGSVEIWGEWGRNFASDKPHEARWSGIADWSTSPLKAFLAPLVADAVADVMDEPGARHLLHLTGFLAGDADPVEMLRFFASVQPSDA